MQPIKLFPGVFLTSTCLVAKAIWWNWQILFCLIKWINFALNTCHPRGNLAWLQWAVKMYLSSQHQLKLQLIISIPRRASLFLFKWCWRCYLILRYRNIHKISKRKRSSSKISSNIATGASINKSVYVLNHILIAESYMTSTTLCWRWAQKTSLLVL